MIPFLEDAGVPNVAVHLPSSLPASELDDGAHLQSVLDGLEGPVVLVGHSGGAFTITEVGGHPAVRHLVYLDAPLPDAGESMLDVYEPGDLDSGFAACLVQTPEGGRFDADALVTHLEDRGWAAQEAREMASGLVPMRVDAVVLAVTVASWRTVRSTYVGSADSQARRQARARFAARATHAVEISGDHFAFWQRPRESADIIIRIVQDAAA
jgi:pimeloyl-ACP methyl ester carboxylesterase